MTAWVAAPTPTVNKPSLERTIEQTIRRQTTLTDRNPLCFSIGGGCDDDGNNTTANLDFTTEFKASFRNVKPRRPPTARPRRMVAAQGVSDGLGFTIHDEDEPLCSSNPNPEITNKHASQSGAVPSPTIAKPARRRRGTIYIPNDDTTMPTAYMGVFSPLKNVFQLQQQERVQELEEQHTGIAALMLKKRPTAAPLLSKRQSVLVASPKRGCRPPPLGASTRLVQATATQVEDRVGSGLGKENVPPGYAPKPSKPRSLPTKPEIVVQAQIKPSVPTRFVVPLVKVESVNKSFPLLPEGLPEVSLYEEDWLSQQEVAITQLLNCLFTASSTCMDDAAAPDMLRLRLLDEYNKPEVALMHKRVQGALLYGSLSVPHQGGHDAGHHRLYNDLGRRKAFTDLWLETYDYELLKTALEVVTGRAVNTPRQSSSSASTTWSSIESNAAKLKKRLKLFIELFLMRNEDAVMADGEIDGKSSSLSSYSRTLLRSLMLIKVLDLAKTTPGLSKTATPLFLATSPYKTSSSVLLALMQMLNPSTGDPSRALAHLGYSVSHEQHALEEYDYQITNLAVDLRDGVRLVRLVELLLYRSASPGGLEIDHADVLPDSRRDRAWPMSQHLKVPCIGRATKLFNVQIALTALSVVKGLEPVIRDISAEDIVDGFREKTMKLLWSLTSKWGLEGLLDWKDVQCEIGRLHRAAGKVGSSFFGGPDGVDDADEENCGHGPDNNDKGGHRRYTKHKALLQEWAKSVAALHGLTVRTLTTSFADGRVFEAIVDHYTPHLPSSGSSTRKTPCLSERLKALGCSDQFAQLFATGPGAAGKHHIFDRDFTLASLAFLCSRLLGPSKRARAATVLQRAWRRRWEVVVRQRKAVLQGLAHACADAVRNNDDHTSQHHSRNSVYTIIRPRAQGHDDPPVRFLSVSAGAVVTGPANTIEIARTRSRSGVRREQSRDFDDYDDHLRDGNAYGNWSGSNSVRRRDSAREERPTGSLGERSSYRSERFLSVPGTVALERTRSAAAASATSRPISISSGRNRERQAGDDDDGGGDSGGSSGGGRRPPSRPPSRPSSRPSSRLSSRRPSNLDLAATTAPASSPRELLRRLATPVRAVPGSAIREFRYTPLDPNVKQAIRVLRVRPDLVVVDDGDGDGNQHLIACDLEHTSITQTSYSTVSYAWGDPDDPTRRILVDGCTFNVRKNLYELLRHVHRYHAGRAIWIDAIAINQTDLDEKSRQVQMMSKIYAGTSEVFVWLGPRVDYVGHAIRCMQQYEDMTDYAMAMRISRDDNFWRGFRAINSAVYWNRVWVIQEFVTPREGRIIQGDRWVSFGCFQQTIRRFDTKLWRWGLKPAVFWGRNAEDFAEYISNIHPLWQRRIVRAQADSRRKVADAQWALLSGRRYCQDIRDRVYGIMPLATHGSTLRVDYHLNPFEVLLESIWLEHDSHMDRTEVLMNLANILLLTPASVCIYAQKKTSRADSLLTLTDLPRDERHTEQIHLRAAASPDFQSDWIRAASDGNSITWRNFAVDQRLKLPKNVLTFPSRRQCPWSMFVYTSAGHSNVGLKLAVDSRAMPPDESGRVVCFTLSSLNIAVFHKRVHGLLAALNGDSNLLLDECEEPAWYRIVVPSQQGFLAETETQRQRNLSLQPPPNVQRVRGILKQNASLEEILRSPMLAELSSLTVNTYGLLSTALGMTMAGNLSRLRHLTLNFAHPYIHDPVLPPRYWTTCPDVNTEGSPAWNALAGFGDQYSLALRMTGLQTLSITRAAITSAQLVKWIDASKELCELRLDMVAGVDNNFVQWLADDQVKRQLDHRTFRVLSIQRCPGLHLRKLSDVRWIQDLADAGLQELILRGCRNVDSRLLRDFVEEQG
ncbi:hypothetical protein DV737_g4919, partial [Chaetothyriales sp. CBS 132003]